MYSERLRTLTKTGGAIAVLAISLIPTALAGQQTSNLDLTLTLVTPVPTCSAAVDAVNFGSADAGSLEVGGAHQQNFNMNLNCSGAVAAATATFDSGTSPAGAFRGLTETGGARVSYTLAEIGNIISLDETINFSAPTGASTVPLIANLTIQTFPTTIGAYSDQVVVTFTF